jgi:hypothetical protein
MTANARPRRYQKIGFTFWLLLWCVLIAAHLYPIRDSQSRSIIVGTLFLLWIGALWLSWPKKPLRWACLALLFIAALIFGLPGRDDPQALRDHYVRALHSYENTPYVWGGETHRGIDCSGLLRAALIDANRQHGARTLNPRLLRAAATYWLRDCSAMAMRDEYRGWTRLLFTTPSLNELDHSRLLPGDIAVTEGGGHCLAYLGNKTWIEADPNALYGDKVIKVTVPTKNAWFSVLMHIMRWRQMEPVT